MTIAILFTFCLLSVFIGAMFTFIVMDERAYHFGADEYARGYRDGIRHS
jgi:hypothetical protein